MGQERVESLEDCEESRALERKITEKTGAQKWNDIKEGDEEMEFILGFKERSEMALEETKGFLKEMWKERKVEGRYIREEGRDHEYGHWATGFMQRFYETLFIFKLCFTLGL